MMYSFRDATDQRAVLWDTPTPERRSGKDRREAPRPAQDRRITTADGYTAWGRD